MATNDVAHNREAEPGSATRGADSVQPNEPLEDPGPVGLGNSGAIVYHPEDHGIRAPRDRDVDPVRREPQRVLVQVSDDTLELTLVAAHLRGAARRERGPNLVPAADLRLDQFGEVDGAQDGRRPARPGQQKEIVDGPLQAVDLLEDAAMRCLRVRAAGAGDVDLQLRSNSRQRRAQLVRRVGGELGLTGRRLFDSVDHLVHGARQLRDLVVDRGHRNSPIERLASDRGDFVTNGLDRPKRSPHQDPDGAGQNDRHNRNRGGQRPRERRVSLVEIVDGLRDQHEPCVGRDHEDAIAVVFDVHVVAVAEPGCELGDRSGVDSGAIGRDDRPPPENRRPARPVGSTPRSDRCHRRTSSAPPRRRGPGADRRPRPLAPTAPSA